MKYRHLCLLSLLVSLLPGCFFIPENEEGFVPPRRIVERDVPPEGVTGTGPVKIESLDQLNKNNVELVWQAPEEPVDAFVIRYGSAPGSLTNEMKVDVFSLEKVSDPDFGTVYRYLLRNIPSTSSIFVSIASVSRGVQSEPSPVFEARGDEGGPKGPSPMRQPSVN